jgi:hypothetical protein
MSPVDQGLRAGSPLPPEKANVVADVLSRKAHCNYLPVVCLAREESSTQMLPDLSLFNITLTPTLRDEIKAM